MSTVKIHVNRSPEFVRKQMLESGENRNSYDEYELDLLSLSLEAREALLAGGLEFPSHVLGLTITYRNACTRWLEGAKPFASDTTELQDLVQEFSEWTVEAFRLDAEARKQIKLQIELRKKEQEEKGRERRKQEQEAQDRRIALENQRRDKEEADRRVLQDETAAAVAEWVESNQDTILAAKHRAGLAPASEVLEAIKDELFGDIPLPRYEKLTARDFEEWMDDDLWDRKVVFRTVDPAEDGDVDVVVPDVVFIEFTQLMDVLSEPRAPATGLLGSATIDAVLRIHCAYSQDQDWPELRRWSVRVTARLGEQLKLSREFGLDYPDWIEKGPKS